MLDLLDTFDLRELQQLSRIFLPKPTKTKGPRPSP